MPKTPLPGLPPLIERDIFFSDPEVSGAQISPDGRLIAFLKPWNGARNIWVKGAEEPFEAARRVTADARRSIRSFHWSRDSKFILFYQDEGGNEDYNIFAVNPEATVEEGDVPPARNITVAEGITAVLYHQPKSEPDIIYAGLNDRDKSWHDLYRIRLSTGARELLRKNEDRVVRWHFDNNDKLRLGLRIAENGDREILRVDGAGFKKIYGANIFETCVFLRFHHDNKRFYLMTDRGDKRKRIDLALVNAETGAEEQVETDPEKRYDLSHCIFSERTDALLATAYVRNKMALSWRDKDYASDHALMEKSLPGMVLSYESRTADENRWLIWAYSDRDPGATYLFDRTTKKLSLVFRLRDNLPIEHMAAQEVVTYPSRDELEIPAYLSLPPGVLPKQLPLIVLPHGGPWSRTTWAYNGEVQFLVNRGYAVLQPNFRGSTGFGKDFLNAGNCQWGQLMQDDITWGVRAMVQRGIADPKRTAIMGASYGGYAALAGVAFTSAMYKAAVAIVAPSSLFTLLESIPPYWESIREQFYRRMGDPRTEEGKAQLTRQSPLFSAHKITTPLMVVQGANDPRVTKRESDQIVAALQKRNYPVEYLVAADEGHGFSGALNRTAMYAAIEKFLARYMGGRYQAEMSPEVRARVAKLTDSTDLSAYGRTAS